MICRGTLRAQRRRVQKTERSKADNGDFIVELLKCEPNYHLWFSDGESFTLSTDVSKMKEQIEKYEGKGGFESFLGWMQEAHMCYEVSVREVLKKNFMSLPNLVRPSFLRHIIDLHPFESIYYRVSKYFKSERLRRVFTFGSMYMGMSPYEAPGTYQLLQYTELAEGIWYPVGGFHAVVQALVNVCERLGVDFRLNTAVKEVLTSADGRTATGVRLASGETLNADVVVVNADLVYAYNNLFPESKVPKTTTKYAKSLQKRDGSCSSISFYWSLKQQVPELTTHNIFLADEYKGSFDQIFKEQNIPDEPSFYVNVPSRVDPTAAPDGKDSIVVLVPVGHLLNATSHHPEINEGKGLVKEQDWEQMVSSVRSTIMHTIETRTKCAPLAPLIAKEVVNNPYTWEEKFNLDKGSILGLSHSFWNVLAFRPKTKHAEIKNCYFVGASTHPGTGVPIVLAGAKITTEQIFEDLGISIPWAAKGPVIQDTGVAQNKAGPLDVKRKRWGYTDLLYWSFVLLALWSVARSGVVPGIGGKPYKRVVTITEEVK